MLIHNYKISKRKSLKEKWFEIILKKGNLKIVYNFSGEDVFSGDYWDSIFIDGILYDINFFKYPNYRLSIYQVENNNTKFEKFISI